MEIKEIHKRGHVKMAPERYEELVKKKRKEDDRLVKGMFEFVDAQGGWLDFSWRYYKDEPIRTFKIVHGEICELPMGIVKHLNNCVRKVRTLGAIQNPQSRGVPQTLTKISRMRFTPMDLM